LPNSLSSLGSAPWVDNVEVSAFVAAILLRLSTVWPSCRGNVSTNNSGGFVSVRCKNFEPALDLAAYEGLKLRVLGNGLRYKCIIRTDAGWDGVGYCRWAWVTVCCKLALLSCGCWRSGFTGLVWVFCIVDLGRRHRTCNE